MQEAHTVTPLRANETFPAYLISAGMVVDTFRDESNTPEQRFAVLGNFLLATVIMVDSLETLSVNTKDAFRAGLELAGASREGAEKLGEFVSKRDIQRIIYSLNHIPEGMDVPGFIKKPKSKSLDEPTFIRSINGYTNAA